MRRLILGLIATAILGIFVGFSSGALSLVETHGNSMAPRITTGDLVIVRASSTYQVGEVVAYSSPELRQVVLHRVKALQDGQYTFRGDHNDFDDPEQLTQRQLIGKELLHIPHGGLWLDRLTSPTGLGILTFGLLLAGGGTTVATRRRRRKNAMSAHASLSRTPPSGGLSGWSPRSRTAATAAAVTATVGILLCLVSWTQPTASGGTATQSAARTMTFSYEAEVPASPAYDDTRVTAPAPIFRNLADQLDLSYSYQGGPGSLSVVAELTTASGWQSTVPLRPTVDFTDSQYAGSVRLHLDQLDRRAQAAAEATGIPATQVDIAVVATVTTADGHQFTPRLAFTLTPLQLTLVGGQSALTVTETTSAEGTSPTDDTLELAGYQVSVSTVRTASAALVLAGFLTLLVLGLAHRRTATTEAAAIKRRYAPILLGVEPVPSPPGRPVIDVHEFVALARIAERYGLLVMHWTRSNVETFVVHDDGITYRYRTGTGHRAPMSQPSTGESAGHSTDAMSGRPA